MAKLLEYFIAQRIAQGAKRSSGTSGDERAEGGVMLRIATLAIALSVAVMLLSLAVIFGFKSEVHTRLTALSGDILVTSPLSVKSNTLEPITKSEELERVTTEATHFFGSEIRHLSPYATRTAIVRTAEGIEGVVLKGITQNAQMESFVRGLREGEIPTFGGVEVNRNTIISNELASELGLNIGSRLELLISNDDGSIRRDLYRVGAIYSAGTGLAEKAFVFTDIRNVQRINGWASDQISGYEVSITNPSAAAQINEQINLEVLFSDDKRLDGVASFTTEQLYPAIFDWLSALDINAIVVISIMLIVAIFNIITAILILVLERVQMIGVLKALGMNNGSVRKIFLFRALSITLRGLVWGNGIGLTIALVQRSFHIIKLDEGGYILDSVPISLGATWIIALNVAVVVAILL